MSITKNTPKSVNINAKSLLAKCMATENIRVVHDNNAETAAFDVKNRELVLPVWKDMGNSMYDMLVAHEVSHALHTPFESWVKAMEGVKNVNAFKQIANVVEDARIERMIKDKFPGIRKDFARAYGQLHEQDLFEINGVDLSTLNLIDRLNLEFKLGLFGLIQVPFSAEENQWVTKMTNTETFDDVIELTRELFEDWNNQNEQNDSESQESQESQESSDSQDGSGGEGTDENAVSRDAGDTSEGTDGVGDNANAMSQPNLDDIRNPENNQNGDQDGTGDGDGAMGDGDSDSENDEGETGSELNNSMTYEDYSEGGSGMPSSTQSAYDKSMRDMVNTESGNYNYYDIPESMNLDNCILDYTKLPAIWTKFEDETSNRLSNYPERAIKIKEEQDEIRANGHKFVAKSKSIVNHMVSQFQMKQSANADRRTMVSKTGILNTTTMMNYRWSEDIFMTNQEVADGKNHGMIFFLDWSGSMWNIMKDTVEQLLILTEFCNKIQIPFEVYAFSSKRLQGIDDNGHYIDDFEQCVESLSDRSTPLKAHDFTLINFLSSRMNKQEYKEGLANLYYLSVNHITAPTEFSTGCTPLNESIICALDIVPQFQESTGVQIVNTVFLTDGEGQSLGAYGGRWGSSKSIVHDSKTKLDVEFGGNWRDETKAYLEILKHRTNCNIIGIRLYDAANIKGLRYQLIEDQDVADCQTMYKKSNYCLASPTSHAYDELFIVRGNLNATEDIFDNIKEDASHAQMRNAFRKAAGSHKSSRVIATKMAEIFASTA